MKINLKRNKFNEIKKVTAGKSFYLKNKDPIIKEYSAN